MNKRLKKYGKIVGFERADGDRKRRVQVNKYDARGIFHVKNEYFVEDSRELYPPLEVYRLGEETFSVDPFCENCKQVQFLLDDGTLHCPPCENN